MSLINLIGWATAVLGAALMSAWERTPVVDEWTGEEQISQGRPSACPWWLLPGIPAVGLSGLMLHAWLAGLPIGYAPYLADVAFAGLMLAGGLAQAKLQDASFGAGLLTIFVMEGQMFCCLLLSWILLFPIYIVGWVLILISMLLLPVLVLIVPVISLVCWADTAPSPLGRGRHL